MQNFRIKIDDSPRVRLDMYYDRGAEEINNACSRRGRVLVHCNDGDEIVQNRSRNNVILANKRQASRHLLLSLCFDRIISSLILSVVSKILYSDE
jgi:hypothetical protein